MYEPWSVFNGADLLVKIDGKIIGEAQEIVCDETNKKVSIKILLFTTIVDIEQHMEKAKIVEEWYCNEQGKKLYRKIELGKYLGKKSIVGANITTGELLYNYKLKKVTPFEKVIEKIEEEKQDERRN